MVEEQIAALFAGLDSAHGTYEVKQTQESGKHTGKAVTVREPVTAELWAQHFAGKRSLGVVPICADNTCRWGCIDIDQYQGQLEHGALVRRLRQMNLPVVVARSKSGGAHVFLFTTEPVPAGAMRAKLREIAAGLGYGSCEIFPKQSEVLADRGDVGNWLNMPYFGGNRSNRYGFKDDGTAATMEEFVELVELHRVRPDQLDGIVVAPDQEIVKDGPPCLEYLVGQGFPAGTRNNGLFALGVYFRKAFPDEWEAKLDEFNRTKMDPPKSSSELQDIIKSLRKKDYGYRCNEPPINAHCNRALCAIRKHGIGAAAAMPTLGSLAKQDSDPAVWFLDVDGARIELTTDELMNQAAFQKRVLLTTNRVPPRMKEAEWTALLNVMLENLTVLEAPRDASTAGHFEDLLETFCTSRFQARAKDELLMGKPWTDEGKTYLRLKDLMQFLSEQRFTDYSRAQVAARLKERDGEPVFFNLKGRGVRAWAIPAFDQPTDGVELPPLAGAAF